MNNWHILTECYVDTLLVEELSHSQKGYNHQHSCTKVLNTMKTKLQDVSALGIIDDDKSVPKDLDAFLLLKQANAQLSILKHKDKPHYIVVISKAIEEFILKNAQNCDISLLDYGLPNNLNDFLKITKHLNSKREENNANIANLKHLFKAIKKNEKSDFHKLAQWIEIFKENPYHLNKELL